MKYLNGKNFSSALAVWTSFVFLQSGFFKFTGAPETVYIFNTVGAWMTSHIHPIIGALMTQYGGYVIGSVEYVASALLLVPVAHYVFKKTGKKDSLLTFLGAFLAFGVMTGALFFHLFTPLGINVQDDGGSLFGMAVSVWVSALILIYKNKKSVGEC